MRKLIFIGGSSFLTSLSTSVLLFLGLPVALAAGEPVSDLSRIQAPQNLENIHVQPLAGDKHASQYLIFIKNAVNPHFHKTHSETIYILEGKGMFRLGEKDIAVAPGFFIQVPVNTVHGVKVTSAAPMKVLSVQAPQFLGKDRVFVDK